MMKKRPRYTANIRLGAVPAAATCSRVFLKHTLDQWRVPGLYDTAALVVTELVTNSVKETGIVDVVPTWDDVADTCLVDVRVLAFTDCVSIHVWDCSRNPPIVSESDPAGSEMGGRGLILVERLSRRVGHFYPKIGGKVVYADLSWDDVSGQLPQSVGRKRTAIDFPEADVELLRTLLDGLHTP